MNAKVNFVVNISRDIIEETIAERKKKKFKTN